MQVGSTGGKRREKATPRPNPNQLTASGRMRMRTSVMVRTIMRLMKKSHLKVSAEKPKVRKQVTKRKPVRSSMTGYMTEIGAAQERHLPRRMNQESTGMLS